MVIPTKVRFFGHARRPSPSLPTLPVSRRLLALSRRPFRQTDYYRSPPHFNTVASLRTHALQVRRTPPFLHAMPLTPTVRAGP